MSEIVPFSKDQESTLASVLDEIIPPSRDGKLPGAGQLGLAAYIDRASEKMPAIRAMISEGLTALAEMSFAALPAEDRRKALEEQGFLPILVLHTFAGYYQNGRVLEALTLEPRPPHPKGYEMEPNDLSLLDQVRARPQMFRK